MLYSAQLAKEIAQAYAPTPVVEILESWINSAANRGNLYTTYKPSEEVTSTEMTAAIATITAKGYVVEEILPGEYKISWEAA